MARYSKEIKRAQDKAKSGKSTKITGDPKKFEGVGSAYEAVQRVSQPKKKVVKKTETVTTTNGSSTSNVDKLRNKAKAQGAATRLYSAVKSGAEKHRQQEKDRADRKKGRADRRREVKDTPFGMRTVAGRAMLDDAGKAELAKRKARRQSVIRERSPVTTTNIPSSTEIQKLRAAMSQTKKAEAERDAENARRAKKGMMSLEEQRATDDDFLKTGGKVSRKKGGTVSRKAGGTVWNGNSEVSKYYDM